MGVPAFYKNAFTQSKHWKAQKSSAAFSIQVKSTVPIFNMPLRNVDPNTIGLRNLEPAKKKTKSSTDAPTASSSLRITAEPSSSTTDKKQKLSSFQNRCVCIYKNNTARCMSFEELVGGGQMKSSWLKI